MTSPVIARMESRVSAWEEEADHKAVFLSCYLMMTRNTLEAIDRCEFGDCDWVARLLHRFADYYFDALDAYEQSPESTPTVWRLAHDATHGGHTMPVQKLLVGVNAHINYDLVLTLVDLLEPEWDTLSAARRSARYADHCHVNDVIGRTIDAVQDEVLGPAMPVMRHVDSMLGPFDEYLISRLIARWRETVWQNAVRLLEAREHDERARLLRGIEDEAVRLGHMLAM